MVGGTNRTASFRSTRSWPNPIDPFQSESSLKTLISNFPFHPCIPARFCRPATRQKRGGTADDRQGTPHSVEIRDKEIRMGGIFICGKHVCNTAFPFFPSVTYGLVSDAAERMQRSAQKPSSKCKQWRKRGIRVE